MWAIMQLLELRSPQADASLDRLASEIRASPQKSQDQRTFEDVIENSRRIRSAKRARPIQENTEAK
jgi:hypothetical protein